jgi:pentatricopeptide repeat protein
VNLHALRVYLCRPCHQRHQLFDVMPGQNDGDDAMVCYAPNGMLKEAKELFDRMKEEHVVAWKVMVKACINHGLILEAWKFSL